MASHIFGIEGTVVRQRVAGAKLLTLEFRVTRSLPTAIGYAPYEGTLGATAIIHFDERLDRFHGLPMREGDKALVYFGEIDNDGGWGSNSNWLAVWHDGAFRRADGSVTNADALFPHEVRSDHRTSTSWGSRLCNRPNRCTALRAHAAELPVRS